MIMTMSFSLFLQQHFLFTLITTGVLGLIIGSFLNVVIVRYPQLLERAWRVECQQFLALPVDSFTHRFNLAWPGSHCPECKHALRLWENIPIISFLLLGGKCSQCKTKISWRYPIVELLTAILSIWVLSHFGITLATLPALLLTWGLIALSFIDLEKQILPDTLIYILLWLGLLLSLLNLFTPSFSAITGAVFGYLLIWATGWVYKLIRKREGMGLGDAKLLALFGAWLGVDSILNIIIVAVVLALLVALPLLLTKRIQHDKPIPFGPFIAIAGFLSLLYGPTLTNWIALWIT